MKVETNSNVENVADLAKTMPKDAHVMSSILKDMGIHDWEPRVVNQLLEFSYNYVTTVLDDAKNLSSHAKKKNIDVEDVRLAVQMYSDQNVTSPPPRDVLLEVARTKNITTLPIPKPTCGLRLPPDRFCLTSCNYKLKNSRKQTPRSGPYYFGSTSGSMKGASHSAVNNFTLNPQTGLIPGQPMGGNRPIVKINAMHPPTPNKIKIQPNSTPPMFTMTINPATNPSLKRKADDLN